MNKRSILAIKSPVTGYILIRHPKIKGFAIRISPKSRRYVIDKWVSGKLIRRTIGDVNLIPYKEALKMAKKWTKVVNVNQLQAPFIELGFYKSRELQPDKQIIAREAMALGMEVFKERMKQATLPVLPITAPPSITTPKLSELIEEYTTFRKREPSTKRIYGVAKRITLRTITDKQLHEITSEDINAIRKAEKESSCKNAFKMLTGIYSRYNTLHDTSIPNPIKKSITKRPLSPDEKRQFHIHNATLPEFIRTQILPLDLQPRLYFLTLIFTGMRNQEPIKAHWKDINLTTGRIIIRATKNRTDLSTYLIPPLLELYKEWRALHPKEEKVFLVSNFNKLWRDLRKKQDPVWQEIHRYNKEEVDPKYKALIIHDLRRTFTNLLGYKLKIPEAIVEQLTSHKPSTMTRGYMVGDEGKVDAMDQVNNWYQSKVLEPAPLLGPPLGATTT